MACVAAMTPLALEKWFPLIVGVLVYAAVRMIASHGIEMPHSEEFLSALLSLGGIIAGFTATIQPLMISLGERLMTALRSSGYDELLVAYLREAFWGGLLVCALSIFGFVVRSAEFVSAIIPSSAGLLAVTSFAFAAVYRVSSVTLSLLQAKTD